MRAALAPDRPARNAARRRSERTSRRCDARPPRADESGSYAIRRLSAAISSTTAWPRSIACRWHARSRCACRCSTARSWSSPFALPARLKFDASRTKILLKRVAARHVPRECVYRPKEGFSIPIKHWLQARASRPRRAVPGARAAAARRALRAVTRRASVAEHLSNRANHSHLLWSLLVFEQWRERSERPACDRARRGGAAPARVRPGQSSAAASMASRCCTRPRGAAVAALLVRGARFRGRHELELPAHSRTAACAYLQTPRPGRGSSSRSRRAGGWR